MRVLPQREWENREREIYQRLHRASIQIDPDGTVILPWLPGETLATILQDPSRAESVRTRAIELSVVALAEFHRRGLTHGDAMAENVMVDLDGGAAHWFDYETIHQSGRPMAWRRADDVRALLVTCILRTAPARVAEILRFILDVYADDGVAGVLVENFGSALRRPLAFHLAQAPLSFRCFRQIAQVLRQRLHGPGTFSQHTSLTKSS